MEIMSKMNCPSWTGNNNYCAKFVAGNLKLIQIKFILTNYFYYY